jgi:hypothetical protein
MAVSPVVAAVVVFLFFQYIIRPAFFSPLSQIPNAHWSAPFSRLWILWIRFVHRENRTLHHAHRRLGPVIRVGPNELSINDLDSVRTVYQGGFEKPVWYSVFDNYGYDESLGDSCKGLCSHIVPKVSLACSRLVLRRSTRHGSG